MEFAYPLSTATSIYCDTSEILKSILAELSLGLPRSPSCAGPPPLLPRGVVRAPEHPLQVMAVTERGLGATIIGWKTTGEAT